MEAVYSSSLSRVLSCFSWIACVCAASTAFSQPMGAGIQVVRTPNFIVSSNNAQWSEAVARAAEANRRDLAIHWLGEELPKWSAPCHLAVHDAPNRQASGETTYTLIQGAVINFRMTVSGTRERILDSVLPHEITHTIIASHFAPFGKPVPRWADEGMCTTVEHEAERNKHDVMLVRFMREQKCFSFKTLFEMRDYPIDILPLYAQGYSLTSFLIAQRGPQEFIRFLEMGMENDDWVSATDKVYGYPRVGKLQTAWNTWVSEGGGEVARFTAASMGYSSNTMLASAELTSKSNEAFGAVQPASSVARSELPRSASGSAVQNTLMHPTSESYYRQQLMQHQQASNEPVASPSLQEMERTAGPALSLPALSLPAASGASVLR